MTHTLDAWSKEIWTMLDPNPELTAALQEAIKRAQQVQERPAAIEELAPKPRSVVEDFDFIRTRIQEIKSGKQTWWCSQCHAHRTQGCDNSACPDRVTMHEDYCYD